MFLILPEGPWTRLPAGDPATFSARIAALLSGGGAASPSPMPAHGVARASRRIAGSGCVDQCQRALAALLGTRAWRVMQPRPMTPAVAATAPENPWRCCRSTPLGRARTGFLRHGLTDELTTALAHLRTQGDLAHPAARYKGLDKRRRNRASSVSPHW
jgi:hypothetical protein